MPLTGALYIYIGWYMHDHHLPDGGSITNVFLLVFAASKAGQLESGIVIEKAR